MKKPLRHYVWHKKSKDGLYTWYFTPDGRKYGNEKKILGHSQKFASTYTFKPSSFGKEIDLYDMKYPDLDCMRKALYLRIKETINWEIP